MIRAVISPIDSRSLLIADEIMKRQGPRKAIRYAAVLSAFAMIMAPSLIGADMRKPDDTFAEVIAPALESKCLRCHNDTKARGGLSLADAIRFAKGGEGGAIVEPGRADESRLLEAVSGAEPEMPPDDEPLPAEIVAALRKWIDAGAHFPDTLRLADKSHKKEAPHWAFQPIAPLPVPEVSAKHAAWAKNPIDRFIAARHERLGFDHAPEADRRTLIRRLSYDLSGLPPDPETVRNFVNDTDPRAYEKLVDRILDSPAYGERWARHWLDIVHYGETHGYDKDKPRPNAWPYRDYVIDSLNRDVPYGRFVRDQIAGDALHPENPDSIKALGFLAAGPWDFIGHAEVPESKTDGKYARHNDRDDMVGTAVGALMSITIQCAQCHDHKFDPFSQADYYRMQAALAAVDRADRPYFSDPNEQAKHESARRAKLALTRRINVAEAQVTQAGGDELARRRSAIAAARGALKPAGQPQFGYHSAIEPKPIVDKWLRLDFETPVTIRKIILSPAYDDFNGIGAGFGFPMRYRVALAEPADRVDAPDRVVYDRTDADQPSPGIEPIVIDLADAKAASSLKLIATKLALRQNDYIFALAEIAVFDESGTNVAPKARLTSLDSIEAPPRWSLKNLTDGLAPKPFVATESTGVSPESLEEDLNRWLATVVPVRILDELKTSRARLVETDATLATMKPAGQVFAATIHTGSGAFAGTGPTGGLPRPIRILPRGDVNNPKEVVEPGPIVSLGFGADLFSLADSNDESERRVALAKWVTHHENPLFWRSIVNRVWQYHFGRGIVDPPGDFGRMGGVPSHPELLDWLAATFRDSGESLKSLHRLIVTSATYRQASTGPREFADRDASNVFLWRQNRRKLEAEAIRDSLLAVSGRLDRRMGGPSFQDFVVERPEHSPHYRYDLADPNDPSALRRSIYRFIVRSQPQPFLSAMDCADPSIRVDKRNESLSAAAALAQWNDASVLAMSDAFGREMAARPGDLTNQVVWGFEKALCRPPNPDELHSLVQYAERFGLARLARLIFNLNEFVFID
jgi:hypothetical protein